jgi:ATP synthase protein I
MGLLRDSNARMPVQNKSARRFTSAVMEAPLTKPIRRVLRWQAMATVVMAAVSWGLATAFASAGAAAGGHAALSAALGGVVNIAAVVVYAFVLGISHPSTAGGTVAAMFRAEASKILVIIVQLWLVLATYKDVVPVAFLATFVITVLLFGIAFLDRD